MHGAVLTVHIFTGTTGLVLGPVAMFAPKRRGRHTRTGTVYHWNMLAVCVSAVGLALMNWAEIWWFVPIAVFSYGNALVGYLAARRRQPGWLPVHIGGMGGSYIALITALLVVNTQPAPLYVWFVPTLVGTPLILWALDRRGLLRPNRATTGAAGEVCTRHGVV